MKTLLKLVVCWIVFFFSMMFGGGLATALHLPLTPAGHEIHASMPALLAGAAVLVAGLYPMARGLAGSRWLRGAAIGAFVFIALGLNTLIEARVFTTMATGVFPGNLLMYAMEGLFTGAAFAQCFGSDARPAPREWRTSDLGRAGVAWLGWPVIYFVFGMCIAPIVIPYYQSGTILGLHIPSPGVVVGTQLLRSVPFLLCSLPLILLWKGSRRGLWLSLGLAHAVTVGLFGLVSGTFLPMLLRVTHSVEITCDSFAYAGLLVLLFGGVRRASEATGISESSQQVSAAVR